MTRPQDAEVNFEPGSTTSVVIVKDPATVAPDYATTFKDSCIICFRENVPGVMMPCCGKDTSDIRFCQDCLIVVAEQEGPGGSSSPETKSTTGRCPTCKKYYRWRIAPSKNDPGSPAGGEERFEVCCFNFEPMGRCRMCNQEPRKIADRTKQLCEPCLLGQEFAFRYECDRCHRKQVIPHPMWKYQKSPQEYSSATWACHQRCGDYTHWKIEERCIAQIPDALIPAEWPAEWQRREQEDPLSEEMRAIVREQSLARNPALR